MDSPMWKVSQIYSLSSQKLRSAWLLRKIKEITVTKKKRKGKLCFESKRITLSKQSTFSLGIVVWMVLNGLPETVLIV